MRRSKRALYLLGWLMLWLPAPTLATTDPYLGVLISEVQTGSASSSGQEFIELFNTASEPIDVSNYQLEYFPASADNFDSPTRTIVLHGAMGPGSYYLVASNDYLTDIADDHYSAGLAQAGGHVRLVDSANTVFDLLGWGSANLPEGTAAPAPDDGESLERKNDAAGYLVDTNSNADDFAVITAPTPESSTGEPPVADTEPQPPADNQTDLETDNPPPPQTNLLPIQITELLPNPAPPAMDAHDEFVELFNPNTEAVDLNGYKLQTGNTYSYSFTFASESLPANGYGAFYVSATGTLLANSGGRARLIDPNGQVISETAAYEDAADGEAWILTDDSLASEWQWTTTATPGAANRLDLPPLPAAKSTKKTSAKKSTTRKVKSAKSKRRVAAKKKPAAVGEREVYESAPESGGAPLNPGILAAVGGLSLAYGGYEYRKDLSNRLHQLRRYRAAWRARR